MPGSFDHLIGGVRAPARRDVAFPPVALRTAGRFSGAVRRAYPVLARTQRQSHAGSCGAHATSLVVESEALARAGATVQLCRLDIYRGARWLEGDELRDVGVIMPTLYRWLREYGTVSEVLRPYDPALVTTWAPPAEWAAERRLMAPDFQPIPVDLDPILAELEAGRCVSFPCLVYRQVDDAGRTGVEIGPDGGVPLGGHARAFAGFDLDKDFGPYGRGGLLIANSWEGWGVPHPLADVDSRFEHQRESFAWLPVSRLGAPEYAYDLARLARGVDVVT